MEKSHLLGKGGDFGFFYNSAQLNQIDKIGQSSTFDFVRISLIRSAFLPVPFLQVNPFLFCCPKCYFSHLPHGPIRPPICSSANLPLNNLF
jgi:hypothetical protein